MAKKETEKKVTEVKAIVMHEIALSPRQTGVVYAETPKALVKTKPGRGGKKVEYIEVGYVISRLNAAFSPLGWEFKITEKGETQRCNEKNSEGEVWVYGELTIIDHKNGYRTTKGQYGQHPIHKSVPIGDAFKAAASDALKKCGSLMGIAQDIYWGSDDVVEEKTPTKPSPAELFEKAKIMLQAVKNIDVLIEYDQKLKEKKGSLTPDQVKELHSIIVAQVDKLEGNEKTS